MEPDPDPEPVDLAETIRRRREELFGPRPGRRVADVETSILKGRPEQEHGQHQERSADLEEQVAAKNAEIVRLKELVRRHEATIADLRAHLDEHRSD